MKQSKINRGAEYAIKMMTQYSEKTVKSKKVYSKKHRKANKIKYV